VRKSKYIIASKNLEMTGEEIEAARVRGGAEPSEHASNASSVEKRSAVILTADKMSALPTRN